MKKKILIAAVILVLVLGLGIVYLNRVFLPIKIKSLIILSLQEQTDKNVTLESVQFNLFKGLVLKNLVISDGANTIVSLKEGACTFLVWPIFKKVIIIPTVYLKSALINLERRADKTFNVVDLLPKQALPLKKSKFSLIVYKIRIKDSRINFRDNTFSEPFQKAIEALDLDISLSLANRARFRLSANIPATSIINIAATGEYRITARELAAKISLANFMPKDFLAYYPGLKAQSGVLNSPVNISADLTFNQKGIFSDNLRADFLGLPLSAKLSLKNLAQPLFEMNISASPNLSYLEHLFRDKFAFDFGGAVQGKSNISLRIDNSGGAFQFNGYADVLDTGVKMKAIEAPFSNINGRIEFGQNQLRWRKFTFKYLNILYTTGGTLTNFHSPAVQLTLSSDVLSLKSVLAVNNRRINLTKLSGKYLNSDFFVSGDIALAEPADVPTTLSAELNLNLVDLKKFEKLKAPLEQIKLQGLVKTKLDFSGNLKDIKSATLSGRLYSNSLSAWGLKAEESLIEYNQAAGVASIPSMHLSLYDGAIEARGGLNLMANNLPYWLEFAIDGVKIEKLKFDTPAKNRDISGIIQAGGKINGLSGDLLKLAGSGGIRVSEGKLWELDLFKGMGKLIFIQDFANIIFHEGSCTFSIKDGYIFTNRLELRSNITNLAGPVKIGFDKSINASLDVQIIDEMVPLSGTFKDIATAIVGKAGRFGVIKISGTLKEPKYKFQPAVLDIIEGLKDVFLGR